MKRTLTVNGLEVAVTIKKKIYKIARKVTADLKKSMPIVFDKKLVI